MARSLSLPPGEWEAGSFCPLFERMHRVRSTSGRRQDYSSKHKNAGLSSLDISMCVHDTTKSTLPVHCCLLTTLMLASTLRSGHPMKFSLFALTSASFFSNKSTNSSPSCKLEAIIKGVHPEPSYQHHQELRTVSCCLALATLAHTLTSGSKSLRETSSSATVK